MNQDSLNRWLTLLANFGVIAGIVFLALEVRQNEEMLSHQYELAVLDSNSLAVSRFSAIREIWLENPELYELYIAGMSGAELDDNDQLKFNLMCAEHIWSNALMYERAAVLDNSSMRDTTVKSTQEDIETNPGFKTCWERRRDRMRDWGYGDYIDSIEAKATK